MALKRKGCKDPTACQTHCISLLNKILGKWNPERATKLSSLEEWARAETTEEGEGVHNFNPCTELRNIKDGFQTLTGNMEQSNILIKQTPEPEHAEVVSTYTDRSSQENRDLNAVAGSGVWYGDRDH